MTVGKRAILHVDMDAFYAAVEERENPALLGKPVVVGSEPKEGRGRGVVATANYAARRYGIGSAMPISEAWRRCPKAVYLRPRMRLYSEISRRVRQIFERFTDLIEPISIDEAFLDVTASRRLYGDGPTIAARIKSAIREEERLTASIGCAGSKFIAKIASDLDKPDGLVVVEEGQETQFLAPLPIGRLWGAGPKALERFRRLGCATIGEVATLDRDVLLRAFGDSMGDRFSRLSRGVDDRPVVSAHVRKSLGKETTFGEDVADRKVVERALLHLTEQVATSLRRKHLAGATVTVKLRWEGFETVTRRRTLREPVNTVEKIWPVAQELFRAADRPRLRVRLVGVTLSSLDRVASGQADLFVSDTGVDTRVAEAVDVLAERFGSGTVTRAALLEEAEDR
ncbi:MAG: DNA polymerase IV [Gemmatimonadetes bacterium]|nr:DNA polymerase IV [Gemmatimonadota bacterium]MBT8478379.1 DNA polymerase IV [Gemmatimonadota bacterium]NNK48707.1 DNA polymerase IV [Gemmatimonadota bacterium]